MAENCVFCGRTLSFWERVPLSCGGVDQPACGDCAEKHGKEPLLQRARLALDTGRAREPEKLMAYIDMESRRQEETERRQQARAEQLQRAKEGRQEVIRCCGFEMTREGQYTFMDQTPFALRMFPEYTPELVLFRCEVCGQVKLFDASFFPPEEGGTERDPEPPEEQIVCPECGTRHSPRINCPSCAVRAARSGRIPRPAEKDSGAGPGPFKPARRRFGKKPPWEK